MFRAKRKDTNKIYQILDTYITPTYHQTYFLIWENNGWRWRPANKFVPPNYVMEDNNEIKNTKK